MRIKDWTWGLCAASILLATLQAAAQTPAPRSAWTADQLTGCKIWDSPLQKGETFTWSGACKNGMAQGKGIVQWFADGKPGDRYEGEFRDGKPNGQIVFHAANGDTYQGEFRDGNLNGNVLYTFADGSRYEGEFRDNKIEGHGVISSPDGRRYDGDWRNWMPNGHGVFTYDDGSHYDGEWKDGKPNGLGIAVINNVTYEGNWAEGCFLGGNKRTAFSVELSSCP